MSSTALQIVQDFCEKMALPVPQALVGNTERSVSQYRALLLETVEDLGQYKWQQQRILWTWPSVAGQDQGALVDIWPGYFSVEPNTMWNRTRRMRIFGPLAESIWAALQVLPNAGPEFQHWIAGGHLFISPAQIDGDTLGVTYITSYGVLSVLGVPQQRIEADNDTFLFPDLVVKRLLEAKWRRQKGETGWEDTYNDAMGLVARNIVKEGAATLSLDTLPNRGPRPGIVIPAGSWNV